MDACGRGCEGNVGVVEGGGWKCDAIEEMDGKEVSEGKSGHEGRLSVERE